MYIPGSPKVVRGESLKATGNQVWGYRQFAYQNSNNGHIKTKS
jgi:hypothetical protein